MPATKTAKRTPAKRAPAKSTHAKPSHAKRAPEKKWVATVTTDSTHPPPGLFNKSPRTIARSLASKEVSPKGAVSGLRMLTYFINRGGKNLTEERRAALEKAKALLEKRVHSEKEGE